MRTLVLIGSISVALMVGLIVWLLLDKGEPAPAQPLAAAPAAAPGSIAAPPVRPRAFAPEAETAPAEDAKPEAASQTENEKDVLQFGEEFHQKWFEDRKLLGEERHKQMERLWWEGRRPRGAPEGIAKLEQIVRDYPDSNRAGCATLELGHHYLRARDLDGESRRQKAEEAWRMVEDRYPEAICEFNARPLALSKLGLATWVYRDADPALARRTLQEIIDKFGSETDRTGQPLSKVAQGLLDTLP